MKNRTHKILIMIVVLGAFGCVDTQEPTTETTATPTAPAIVASTTSGRRPAAVTIVQIVEPQSTSVLPLGTTAEVLQTDAQPEVPQQCVPDCAGKFCGSDGCGGSCGICDVGFACIQNECRCPVPFGVGARTIDPDDPTGPPVPPSCLAH